MKEKLQSIIHQKVKGTDAVMILRSAIDEREKLFRQYNELGKLIRQAEDTIVYGQEGRPTQDTFR